MPSRIQQSNIDSLFHSSRIAAQSGGKQGPEWGPGQERGSLQGQLQGAGLQLRLQGRLCRQRAASRDHPPLGCWWEDEDCAAGCCGGTVETALCGGKHFYFDNPPCWECQYERDGACAPCWVHRCLPDCSLFCYTEQPPSPPPPPSPHGCRWENGDCATGCCGGTTETALCGGKHPSFDNPPCWQCKDKRDGTCAPCWVHGCLPDCSVFCYNN